MNDVLSTVRDYYDAEYVYYIEKEYDDVEMIYEWCAENVPWQRDKIKMIAGQSSSPNGSEQEITDTTEENNYSIFEQIREDTTAILAVIGVHKGGCELSLMRAVLPFITQAIVLQKQQKQQEYLSYHDDLTGLLKINSFCAISDRSGREKVEDSRGFICRY